MARIPCLAIFICEKCRKQYKTNERMGRNLIPFLRRMAIRPDGTCKSCRGESWTITLQYDENSADTGTLAIGIGLALTAGIVPALLVGFGLSRAKTSGSDVDYHGVRAEVVAKLNSEPKERMRRISALAGALERQKLVEQGGKDCPACGMMFIPKKDKPWMQNGYCSRSCDPILAAEVNTETLAEVAARRAILKVTCPAGHAFEAPTSFRGMKRACPECGAKTVIEESSDE